MHRRRFGFRGKKDREIGTPMGGTHEQQRQCPPWRRPPWRSTMMAQALLFVALYGALSIGKTQMPGNGDEEGGYLSMAGRHRDLYFISVVGGSRPRDQQMQLLRQVYALQIRVAIYVFMPFSFVSFILV